MSIETPAHPNAILLIEADPVTAFCLRQTFAGDPQVAFVLTVAERLDAGLAHLAQHPYDLVILALHLPDSQGLPAFTHLHCHFPHLPVVICADASDEPLAIAVVQAGAQDYFIKGQLGWMLAPRVLRYTLERHRSQVALRASEERFRALIEHSADVIALLNADGTICYESPSVTPVLGYLPEELVGRHVSELLHPDDVSAVLALFTQLVAQPETKLSAQCRYRRKNGTWCWIEATGTNLLAEPAVQAIVVNYHDVTAHKQAEARRSESEHMFRLLAETMEDVIWQIDAQFTYTYVSPSVTKLYGYTPETLIGKSFLAFMPAHARQRANKRLNEEFAQFRQNHGQDRTPRHHTLQLEQHRQDGTTFWVEIVSTAHYDAYGMLSSFQGVTRDISARKQDELLLEARVQERTAALAALHQRLELATRAAGMGVWDWEPGADQLVCDDQLLQLVGLTRATFDGSGMAFWAIMHPDDVPEQQRLLQNVLGGELEYDGEFRVIWPDRSEHHLRVKAITLQNANGDVERIIGVNYDITMRKQAENLLRRSEETLRQANSELERAMRMKDEFLASMSHELRTPLNSILGFTEALQEQIYGSLNDSQVRALTNIDSSGRHLLALINDILDISKIEAGKIELQFEACSLDEICHASLTLIKGLAQKKYQSVNYTINPPQILIQADLRRLKQILVNLLSNAVKFTPEGGALGLEVQGSTASQSVRLSVWDQGIGIKAEDQPKLFQPFVQLDSSLARQHNGTGLGLSLVQRLTKLHGGTIEIASTPGEGSRFTVVLPWLPVLAPRQLPTPLPEATPVQRTMMTVEDNVFDAQRISYLLTKLGVENVVHSQGHGVLERAILLQPSAILLDLNLPDHSGWAVLAALKANAQTQQIPVVITSGEDYRAKAAALGVVAYLIKPFTFAELRAALEYTVTLGFRRQPVLVVVPQAALPANG